MFSRLFGRARRGPSADGVARDRLLQAARSSLAAGQLAAAEVHLDQLLEAAPGDALARNEAGRLHYLRGDFEAAESEFRLAAKTAPGWPDPLANIGQCLQVRGRFAEAVPQFEAAIALDPAHHEARFNLAMSRALLGALEPALALQRELLREAPDDPDCHVLFAETLLRAGQCAEGWREYAWRARMARYAALFTRYDGPEWNGEDRPGTTVRVWPDQGLGDTLQFMRLVRVAARAHPRMQFVLEVQPPLARLAQLSCRDCDNLQVVATRESAPVFDHHVAIMSLPRVLDCSLAVDPLGGPYLQPDAAEAARWAERVRAQAGDTLAVGLVWAGNRREQHGAVDQAMDLRRSVGAQAMAGLLDVPGCTFFNLQVGARSGEMRAPGRPIVDCTGELGDFAASAALVAGLDLVISVDTSVVHLAGGLGRPIWMLSRYDCCWRWGRRDPASAWYPTLRGFFQDAPGDWASVMRAVRAALEARAVSRMADA